MRENYLICFLHFKNLDKKITANKLKWHNNLVSHIELIKHANFT